MSVCIIWSSGRSQILYFVKGSFGWHWFEKEWTRMSWIEATPHLQWIQSRSNPGGREKTERALNKLISVMRHTACVIELGLL
jgi:hypothetical protein